MSYNDKLGYLDIDNAAQFSQKTLKAFNFIIQIYPLIICIKDL